MVFALVDIEFRSNSGSFYAICPDEP